MPELKVIRCGSYGSVQDLGRSGYRNSGIPVSGVLDEQSAQSANLICGNPENAALLELFGPGWEFEFNQETFFSICGADWLPEINQRTVSVHQAHKIGAGDTLSLRYPGKGRIAYLGIAGGFHSEEVLQSRSWHPQITEPFILKKHMLLPYSELSSFNSDNAIFIKQHLTNDSENWIQAEPGPEWNLLSPDAMMQLMEKEWTISIRSNRMAYFVEEKFVPVTESILTSAVWPGIVQLTPSGQMIILMKDAQTTGGYPRILSLAQNELNKIAQKNPGEKFRLKVKIES
jgi:antagonist of KipI